MTIYDNIMSFLYSVFYSLVSMYHTIEYSLKTNISYYYENNEIFKSCSDYLNTCYNTVMNTCKDDKTEFYGDFYGIIFNENLVSKKILIHDDNITLKKISDFLNMEEIKTYKNTSLYICKDNKKIILLTSNYNDIQLSAMFDEHTEKNRFLSVTYKHPKMESSEGIELDINKEYMLINNTILSSEHVSYLLSHQDVPYEYDENYTLEIMDQKLNTVVLTPNQYILIDNNYSILDR